MARYKLSKEQWTTVLEKIKSGRSVAAVAEEYGVSAGTIYNRLGKNSTADSSTLKISKLERENKALKELVGYITYELSKEKKVI